VNISDVLETVSLRTNQGRGRKAEDEARQQRRTEFAKSVLWNTIIRHTCAVHNRRNTGTSNTL